MSIPSTILLSICASGLVAFMAGAGLHKALAGTLQASPSGRHMQGDSTAMSITTSRIPAASRNVLDSTDAFDPDSNVCLLTIMTQERLASLHRLLAGWDGYVSIAMLVDDYEAALPQGMELLRYRGRMPPAVHRIALSIVKDLDYRSPRNRFPYNMLRNVALDRCEADFVLAADVDFVPFPPKPSARMRARIAELGVGPSSPNVIVIAAFEQVDRADSPHIGSVDKASLRRYVQSGDIVGFASAQYNAGHRCDHIDQFLTSDSIYRVEYEFGCEPYTIVPRASVHKYEERFVGYGKDRVSWNYELAAKRAQFWVLPDVFLVHFNTFGEGASGGKESGEVDKAKKKYGHFPDDWMLGESCWNAFKTRVQHQYNYSFYTCHQRMIDGLRRGKFETCVVESERVCVEPFCAPPTTTFTLQGETQQARQLRGRPFSMPPPPSSPVRAAAHTYPALVMVGCDGCGVPELWRTLVASQKLKPASVDGNEPSWRERQVHFFDYDMRYVMGSEWYLRRWSIRDPDEIGLDGSGSYLQSLDASLRLSSLLPRSTSLLVVLRDPVARASRRWRELNRRPDYARGASFAAKMLAESSALSRCFEAESGSTSPMSLSGRAWERCMATVCALRSCAVGGGVYAPQLRVWLERAANFKWTLLPLEATRSQPKEALRHIFRSLPPLASSALQSQSECLSADLEERMAGYAPNETAASKRMVEPTSQMLSSFFARYNSQLRNLVEQGDPGARALWKDVSWLPSEAEDEVARSAQGLRAFKQATNKLRAALTAGGEGTPDQSAIGSARWMGPSPHPTTMLIGARDGGADKVEALLLSHPGVCGGPMHVFDDDSKYMSGLLPAMQRYLRRPPSLNASNAAGAAVGADLGANLGASEAALRRQMRSNLSALCSRVADTTPYLHSRWASLRIFSTLRQEREAMRFVLVLRDPAERAVLHWRSLAAALVRMPARKGLMHTRQGGRNGGATDLVAYVNGSSLSRKVKSEAAALSGCLNGRRKDGAIETSVDDWEYCTSLVCNWVECILGAGLYAPQLRGWLRFYEPKQFLLFEAKQSQLEPEHVARQLQTFLNLNHFGSLAPLHADDNSSSEVVIGESLKRSLAQFYAPFNAETLRFFHSMAYPGAWQKAAWLQAQPDS